MPPLQLANILHTALPDVCSATRAVISTLVCRNGHAPPAGEVAAWVGLKNRYQMARMLRHDGLPPFEQLAGWTRVLYWIHEAESTGASLLHLARHDHLDPAAAYRLVRRTTGMRWSELRRAGLATVLLRFRDRCKTPTNGWHARGTTVGKGNRAILRLWSTHTAADRGAAPAAPRHPSGIQAGRLAMSGEPFDVAFYQTRLAVVTRTHAAAVDYVALDPARVVASMSAGCVPTRIACAPAGDWAYVTNQFSEEIGVLDLAAGRRSKGIRVPGHPLGALLAPDGHTLYVTTNVDRLFRIWLPTDTVVASTAVPQICAHLALHPSGHRLYLPTWRAGEVLELDARTLRANRSFTVGGRVQDVVVSADGLNLYAANEAGWLDVIHLPSGRREHTIPLGASPFGLALSPDQARLYVGLFDAGRLCILDARSLRVVAALDLGGRPRRMAIDPSGATLLIANEAGWVDIIR